MSDVSVFDVRGGIAALMDNAQIAPAAAEQCVPCGKDSRLALRVSNADDMQAVTVRILAGDGPRAVLGDKDVTVDAGQTAYIALFDTARYKQLDSGKVNVALLSALGGAIDPQVLAGVSIEAAQL